MDGFALEDRCEDLRQPGFVNLAVSILILVGLLISYLPQMVRIISRGTSEGISPYFILLGTTSATAGFANILLLPESRQDVACCKELETFNCVAGLLGIAQLGVQWICFTFIFVLFLVFFRYDTSNVPEEELGGDPPRWQTALLVASLALLYGLVVVVVTAVLSTVAPNRLTLWANLLGLMAAALAAVQYVPQIWTTYHLKHVGSLSIPMMCIQTPGGFLFAGSLFARLGWGGWSSWGIFLLTATMQGVLLCMAVYYELRSHRQREEVPKSTARTGGDARGNGYDDALDDHLSTHSGDYADFTHRRPLLADEEGNGVATETSPLLQAERESRRTGYDATGQ
ncbi:hypothetical protein VTK73DRAFT_585 [Phialemonium thermophilum]|uniref:PQ loop repeat protein n=1 Tax=Phialemonium thermophilum TaxID=223376 RepID=A0ABR3VUS4_9PEZI